MLEIIDKGLTTRAHETPLLFVHGGHHAAWCWNEREPRRSAKSCLLTHVGIIGERASEQREMDAPKPDQARLQGTTNGIHPIDLPFPIPVPESSTAIEVERDARLANQDGVLPEGAVR